MNNINFEAIEKVWFKPKKTALDELEEWVYRYREEHKNDTGIFDKFLTTGDVLRKIQELKKEMK